MNKNLLRRIFAIIGLGAAVCTAVFIPLYFFNMLGAYAGTFGALAAAFVCVTAVFFILAYILKPKETDLGKPEDASDQDASEDGDASGLVPGGETEADDDDVDGNHHVVPDGNGDEERKDEQK